MFQQSKMLKAKTCSAADAEITQSGAKWALCLRFLCVVLNRYLQRPAAGLLLRGLCDMQ